MTASYLAVEFETVQYRALAGRCGVKVDGTEVRVGACTPARAVLVGLLPPVLPFSCFMA